jgi:hypothetical protein
MTRATVCTSLQNVETSVTVKLVKSPT